MKFRYVFAFNSKNKICCLISWVKIVIDKIVLVYSSTKRSFIPHFQKNSCNWQYNVCLVFSHCWIWNVFINAKKMMLPSKARGFHMNMNFISLHPHISPDISSYPPKSHHIRTSSRSVRPLEVLLGRLPTIRPQSNRWRLSSGWSSANIITMTCIRGGSAPFITILHWELHRDLYSLIYERPLTMAMFDINYIFLNCVSQAPEDPSAKPQVKANLGTLMGVYLPTIQV